MAKPIFLPPTTMDHDDILDVDNLEAGLKLLDHGEERDFWDENIHAYRQTVVAAIGETREILRSESMPVSWRTQLERQLGMMQDYVDLADHYLARRAMHVRRRDLRRLN